MHTIDIIILVLGFVTGFSLGYMSAENHFRPELRRLRETLADLEKDLDRLLRTVDSSLARIGKKMEL